MFHTNSERGRKERDSVYLNLIPYMLSDGVKLVGLVIRGRLAELQQRLSWSILFFVVFHVSLDQNVSDLPSKGATTSAPVDGSSAATSTGATVVCDGSTSFTQNLCTVCC